MIFFLLLHFLRKTHISERVNIAKDEWRGKNSDLELSMLPFLDVYPYFPLNVYTNIYNIFIYVYMIKFLRFPSHFEISFIEGCQFSKFCLISGTDNRV